MSDIPPIGGNPDIQRTGTTDAAVCVGNQAGPCEPDCCEEDGESGARFSLPGAENELKDLFRLTGLENLRPMPEKEAYPCTEVAIRLTSRPARAAESAV